MSAADAIRSEVPAVDREDLARAKGFGGGDERRVRKIHWLIAVLLHEFEGARQPVVVEEPHGEPAMHDEITDAIRADAVGPQHVEHFGEDGHGRAQGLADRFQRCDAPIVPRVPRIEEGHEGSRIDEDHRRCFFLSAARTARLTSVEAAIAYPPGPRSRLRYRSYGRRSAWRRTSCSKARRPRFRASEMGRPVSPCTSLRTDSVSSSRRTVRVAIVLPIVIRRRRPRQGGGRRSLGRRLELRYDRTDFLQVRREVLDVR